ncbi:MULTISPECIES: hypothetical protein [Lysobacteraceae]|nr:MULTISPECIES: hypothetical protein [Lysobacter]
MMTRLLFLTAWLVLPIGQAHASGLPLPKDAKRTIAAVHAAAESKDVRALRKLMKTDFVWSFGGYGSADQAIQAWQESPAQLKELARVTSLACSYVDPGIVQCPPDAGMDPRAGFEKGKSGWRMTYFVAGD